jgi:hypothetical protein
MKGCVVDVFVKTKESPDVDKEVTNVSVVSRKELIFPKGSVK